MFTQKHIEESFALFQQLPSGVPFTALRKLATGDIVLDSAITAHDTLNIGDYAVQQVTDHVPTAAGPRPVSAFILYETVMSAGTRWDPPDADLAEFARVRSFADALREIVLREVALHVSNIQHSDALAAACAEEQP